MLIVSDLRAVESFINSNSLSKPEQEADLPPLLRLELASNLQHANTPLYPGVKLLCLNVH
jgi:hypothetical protein